MLVAFLLCLHKQDFKRDGGGGQITPEKSGSVFAMWFGITLVCSPSFCQGYPMDFFLGYLPLQRDLWSKYSSLSPTVVRLDGSQPVRYGLKLEVDDKYRALLVALSRLTGIKKSNLLLVEIFGAMIRVSLLRICGGLPPNSKDIIFF